MIEFLSEVVRTKYNELPLDVQREWNSLAQSLLRSGYGLIITLVDNWESQLEVGIRITKKFNAGLTLIRIESDGTGIE